MADAATVWQALQAISVVGILIVCLIAVTRGAYITRGSHQEVISAQMMVVTEMGKEIARLQLQIDRLEDEVMRLQSALAARGDD
jgi:uncharacterized small protein (DUF1192 family)